MSLDDGYGDGDVRSDVVAISSACLKHTTVSRYRAHKHTRTLAMRANYSRCALYVVVVALKRVYMRLRQHRYCSVVLLFQGTRIIIIRCISAHEALYTLLYVVRHFADANKNLEITIGNYKFVLFNTVRLVP